MSKIVVTNHLNVTIDALDRPGEWHVLPIDYSPFQIEASDRTKMFVPCINMKDKGGKPEGTISIVEIDLS